MAKKRKINENVKIKVKGLTNIEYEAIMNAWRASMLWFEYELRKLADKSIVSDKTLRDITKRIDFSDLLRMRFDTVEPTKLVKMDQVNRVIGEVRDGTLFQGGPAQQPTTQQPPQQQQSPQQQQQPPAQYTQQQPQQQRTIQFGVPNQQTTQQPQPQNMNLQSPPTSMSPEDHRAMLAKDTATAVMELRKMMLQNLNKFKEQYKED